MTKLMELEAGIKASTEALHRRLTPEERSRIEKLRYLAQLGARLHRRFPELNKRKAGSKRKDRASFSVA